MSWYNDWGDFWDGAKEVGDYIPGISNVEGALEGDLGQALLGPGWKIGKQLVGGIWDAANPQVDISKDLKQPTENAQAIYQQALDQAGQWAQYQGPNAITTAPIVAPRDTSYAGYNVEKTKAQDYDAAQATASTASDKVASIDTNINAPRMGDVHEGIADTIYQTQIGAGADAARSQQQAAIQAMGNAPSAAAAMYGQALGRIGQQQLGVANQARGAERAGARREAMLAMGQQGMTAADSAAAASAQEEQAKREAVAQGMSGMRAQDIGLATTQAEIDAQRAQQQAVLRSQMSGANAAAANAWDIQKGQFSLDQQKSMLDASLRQQATRAGLASGDAGALTQTSQYNTGQTNAARAYGATAANTAAQNYADAMNRMSETVSGRTVAQGQQNTDREFTANQLNAQLGQSAQVQNATNQLQAQNLRQGGYATTLGQANTAANTQMQGVGYKAQTATANADRAQKAAGGFMDFLGGGLATAGKAGLLSGLSDERAKKDVRSISDRDLLDFADQVHAVSWRYKPGYEDGGEMNHAGVMAQDLEKTKVGKSLVTRGPDGMRRVDMLGFAGLMAAAAAKSMRKGEARG